MPNKAYCAIMDANNVYITIASPHSYAPRCPSLFGGTVVAAGDDRITLAHEVWEESQTQFRLAIAPASNFNTDTAFVHVQHLPAGANPNAFYHQLIGGDHYNCYLIDTTAAAASTTVTIVPGNAGHPAFNNAKLWTIGVGIATGRDYQTPNANGDNIPLKTRTELNALGAGATTGLARGTLFGEPTLTEAGFNQKVVDYTGASHIISIRRNAIRGRRAEQVLNECVGIVNNTAAVSEAANENWQNFYHHAFSALCALV